MPLSAPRAGLRPVRPPPRGSTKLGARLLGVDLAHFGVVVIVNRMIGLVTPPFGMLLFVTNALTGIPIKAMLREGWLFLATLFALLLAMTCFPQLVLWLPRTMGYGTP